MRTLKVLQIASGDLWAGAEVQFYNLCRNLNAFENVRLYTVVLNPGMLADELNNSGVNPTILNERELSSIVILKHLAKIVRTFKPDIIHSHRTKENVLAGTASLFSPAACCVTTIHGGQETPFKLSHIHKRSFKLLERLFIEFRFRKKIYVSHELQSRLERSFSTKTEVIENGIDIEQTREKARHRHDLDRESTAKNIGFLGRLVPVKRLDILLKIAEQAVSRERLPFIFHIIGDGPLYNELQAQVAKSGLSQYVRMHGFQTNPLPLLASMDCLLITSDHEGLPTNLLEAMCLGIPVIAHAVGEIPRVLDYGRLGTLIGNQDIGSYIDAIRHCIAPEKSINSAVSMRVESHYSAAKNAERYFSLYNEILGLEKTRECPGF